MKVFSKGDIIQSIVNNTLAIVTTISNVTSKLYCLGADGRTFTIDEEDINRWKIVATTSEKLDCLLEEIKEG